VSDEGGAATQELHQKSFDEIAAQYARARPIAPREAFDCIAAWIPPPAAVLEVGCGPGRVTLCFAERGYRVHAVELGAELAEHARRRLAGHPCTVEVGRFEEAVLEPDSFDLVAASSSFHWLDPERALAQMALALRPGGGVALFWTQAGRELLDPDFGDALNDLYRAHAPALPPDPAVLAQQAIDAAAAALSADPRFADLEEHRFTEALELDAPRFIDLLGTYSDHALLDSVSRDRLEGAIADLIDARYGGRLKRHAVTRLLLARRARDVGGGWVGSGGAGV
jgi:SAM-dependent methyltransferase